MNPAPCDPIFQGAAVPTQCPPPPPSFLRGQAWGHLAQPRPRNECLLLSRREAPARASLALLFLIVSLSGVGILISIPQTRKLRQDRAGLSLQCLGLSACCLLFSGQGRASCWAWRPSVREVPDLWVL